MHTNLYLVLEEARTWAVARGVLLACSFSASGDLQLRGNKPAATPGEEPETAQWVVAALDLKKGFLVDDPVATQLRAVLGAPLGLLQLATMLNDAKSPLTVGILAQAADCRAKVAAGQSIDPWQKFFDAEEAAMPKASVPVKPVRPLGTRRVLTNADFKF